MSIAEAKELAQLGVKAPIEVLYHGIEIPVLTSTANPFPDIPDPAIPFLFLGRFHPIKGLDLLLPAFAEAVTQEPRLVLLLAGDGEEQYKAWMKKEIAELGLEGNVRWLGFLQGDQKWQAIASSAAVVMPSYSENFGLVVVEAMMCGTPIIVSEAVALSDEVAAAKAGIVIPCDAAAITRSILILTQDSELKAQMKANTRRLFADKFRLDKVVGSLISAYKQYGRNNHQ